MSSKKFNILKGILSLSAVLLTTGLILVLESIN